MNRRTRFMLTGVMLLGLAISGDPVGAESRLAQRPNANIEVLVDGTGPLVFMIPSLGRGAEDFEQLSQAVIAAGYRVARVQPRGVGRSAGEMEALSMRDFADDAAAGIEAAGGGPAVVLGHAGGQRVARMVAAAHPDLVRAVIMLAAGGKAPALPAAAAALSAVFNEALPDAEHLQAVRVAFFAPGNDPTVWRGGWYPATTRQIVRGPTGCGLASPGIFVSPDEPKLDLLSLESRDSNAVDQRDLSPGMVVQGRQANPEQVVPGAAVRGGLQAGFGAPGSVHTPEGRHQFMRCSVLSVAWARCGTRLRSAGQSACWTLEVTQDRRLGNLPTLVGPRDRRRMAGSP